MPKKSPATKVVRITPAAHKRLKKHAKDRDQPFCDVLNEAIFFYTLKAKDSK